MDIFESTTTAENGLPDEGIGPQANNCCDDCARLEGRVALAERDIEYLQAGKASASVVDLLLRDVEWIKANKAEKTTTDGLLADVERLKMEKAGKGELAAKADISYVDVGLAAKANAAVVAAQGQDIATLQENKADKSALAGKADRGELDAKADKADVQRELEALAPAKNMMNYSMGETVIGTWIDGKPLYRKVISIGTLPNDAIKTVPHGVASIERVTALYGIASYGTTVSLPIPMVQTAAFHGNILLSRSGDDITIRTNGDRNAYTADVIMEYTKNSD